MEKNCGCHCCSMRKVAIKDKKYKRFIIIIIEKHLRSVNFFIIFIINTKELQFSITAHINSMIYFLGFLDYLI
jgi:hypothetical protein